MKIMDFAPIALKNLFSKPVTKNYPEEPAVYPERSRGHIEIEIDKCIMCGICMRKCPSDAITVDRASKTWSIERMGCVQCENCVSGCPKKCLSIVPGYTAPSFELTVDKYTQTAKAAPAKPAPKKEAPAPKKETAAPKAETAPAKAEEAPAEAPVLDSGKIANDMSKCILCGLCSRACPADAITVDRAAKTWSINRDECIQCGACIDGCKKFKALRFAEDDGEAGVVTLTKDAAAPAKPAPKKEEAPKEEAKKAPAPKKERPDPALDGGKIDNDMGDCILCGLCARACPLGAIEVDRKESKTWKIDRDKCCGCGVCIDACRAKHSLFYTEDDFEDGIVTFRKEG